MSIRPIICLLLVLMATLVVGCSSRILLVPHPATNTAGVDLAGDWLLRDTDGGTQPAAREALVYVFLETGRSVRITQTEGALFVSFDRSVVEEYRFGEQRQISVGEVTAQRVSGWESNAYIIETLDKDDVRLEDSYELDAGGDILRRNIRLSDGNDTLLRLTQTYERL